ncbi:MAG: bifunctional diaminohydroxyphosphoribosylaminopyrimidine deaminase/5-amino-6-(5-phosphoribosylamino)uracil reductase RibD [Gammaproteobacteria bacterium]
MNETNDKTFLHQALELAKIRRGFCAPNPSVGAIVVRDGKVLATGYHYAAGFPHAEINALEKLQNTANGATIYVTLEPCCHFGKTPPCTNALIAAGIKRVVYGYRDPNPVVAGKGEETLLAENIEVLHLPLPEIDKFYESYRFWHQNLRPYLTAKLAMTLDGKIAGPNGQPIQMTGKEINQFTHESRKQSDAILTTVKTIIQDNPQLNVRLDKETIAKPLYILDSQLNLPPNAQIFKTASSITVFHAENAPAARLKTLQVLGANCIYIESTPKGLNLTQVIEIIGKAGIHDLWIETGSHCFNAFLQQGLLNRALLYIAPWAIGDGIPAFTSQTDFRNGQISWQAFGKDVLCEILW